MSIKYLLIIIDARTFNRIIRFVNKSVGSTSDLCFMCDEKIAREFKRKLKEENEFIRLRYEEFYMDLTLDKFTITKFYITISFGKVIDYNRTKFIPNPKNKKQKT